MNVVLNISQLLQSVPLVNPSLLAADFADLRTVIKQLEEVGAQILHLDIMDGHFVPNLSFGVPVVEAIRRITALPLDVHLMLANPEAFLSVFRKAGADILSVHIEVLPDPRPAFDIIRKLGAAAGIVSNPPTPVEAVLPFVNDADLILTMSVMPGFGGQSFNPVALEKIKSIRSAADADKLISVDGGISDETIALAAQAGANLFVTGTALLGKPDMKAQFQRLRRQAGANGIDCQ